MHLKLIEIFGTSTNVGPTNVGRYKGQTVQTSDLQTSDWYKRRTSTNVDRYIYKGKRRTLLEFEKKTIAIRDKLKNHSLIVIKIKDS